VRVIIWKTDRQDLQCLWSINCCGLVLGIHFLNYVTQTYYRRKVTAFFCLWKLLMVSLLAKRKELQISSLLPSYKAHKSQCESYYFCCLILQQVSENTHNDHEAQYITLSHFSMPCQLTSLIIYASIGTGVLTHLATNVRVSTKSLLEISNKYPQFPPHILQNLQVQWYL
jgi:hypothetical protein